MYDPLMGTSAQELLDEGWDPNDKFWWRINRGRRHECWPWMRGLSVGYGCIRVFDEALLAHRLSYELIVGPIPDNLVIDHLCERKPCCNPTHMEPVTRGENRRRAPIAGMAAINAAKAVCRRGHELSGDNLLNRLDGTRTCRQCATIRRNEHRQRQRAVRLG